MTRIKTCTGEIFADLEDYVINRVKDAYPNDGQLEASQRVTDNLTLGFARLLVVLYDKRVLSLCETSQIVLGYNEDLEPIEKA